MKQTASVLGLMLRLLPKRRLHSTKRQRLLSHKIGAIIEKMNNDRVEFHVRFTLNRYGSKFKWPKLLCVCVCKPPPPQVPNFMEILSVFSE
jgi:hypothetical protein